MKYVIKGKKKIKITDTPNMRNISGDASRMFDECSGVSVKF